MLLQCAIQFCMLLILLLFIQSKASLLPIYEVYVRVLLSISFIDSVLQIFYQSGGGEFPAGQHAKPWLLAIPTGVTWGLYHMCFEAIVMLLLSRSLDQRTIRRVQYGGALWGVLTCLCVGGASKLGTATWLGHGLIRGWNFFLVVTYCAIWLLPSRALPCTRRPAARLFAMFFFIIRVGSLASDFLHDACVDFIFTGVLFSFFEPFIVYYALLMDTRYWLSKAEYTDHWLCFFATPSSRHINDELCCSV